MDLQDVVRCHHCDAPDPHMQCYICDTSLCKNCKETHLSDKAHEHKFVLFKQRECITTCQKHLSRKCDCYCEQCNIPICAQCVSSREHIDHEIVDVIEKLESRRKILQKDLHDLEKIIYPKYQEIASFIPGQRENLNKNFEKLRTDINKYRKDMEREIDRAISKMLYDLSEDDSKYRACIEKKEINIGHAISEISKSIVELKEVLMSNDISRISVYAPRNAEFKRLPPKLTAILPSFTPQNFFKEQIGSLSAISIKTEEQGYILPPDKPLIDEPWIVTDIFTESNELRGVSCLSDEYVWTCGFDDKIMRLYNLKGELVQKIETMSGTSARDIAVTTSGELIYTDVNVSTVSISNDSHIWRAIELPGWKPLNVCSTSSGDLLVVMINGDCKPTKVVRYSGSTGKQTIQYDGKKQPLYSSGPFKKYICENRNRDICVSDYAASQIVVVNQAGNFKFTYTGHPFTHTGPFNPHGITTDSECRILIADWVNNYIHIIDQYGEFLRYIDNCNLRLPCGLCVGTSDNLFVAECNTGKVKKIQYCI